MPIEAVFWRREALVRLAGRTESFDKLRRPRLAAGRHEDIARLEIAMDHQAVVRELNGVTYAQKEPQAIGHGEPL